MATMKAAIYTGIGEIEVRQVERSRPEPGQVLLDTRCTGICGSDLHSYLGTWQQSHTTAAGHETCGTVAELGEGVSGFEIGDRVAIIGGGTIGQFALAAARAIGGRVVLVSGHYDTADLDLTRIVWSEAIVTGSNCYGYSGMETDFDAAIDLIASGGVAAGKLVSHRLPFDDIAEAFRISADKNRGAVKVHVFQE